MSVSPLSPTFEALLHRVVLDAVREVVRAEVLPLLANEPAHEASPAAPLLMSVNQVAAALALSTKTVRRLIHDGELHAFSIGSVTRIERVELDRFVAYAKARTADSPVDTTALAGRLLSRRRR
jgi:excisionase family DNA binding protein